MKPLWRGSISFGLVNIPVNLFSAEKHRDLKFHLLDNRNQARVHYERINEKTGKKVPWQEIVKGYEFEKDNYVIINDTIFEKTASLHPETIDIQEFVDLSAVNGIYFARPYYLVPNKQGEKAYVLLRETLKRTKKVGVSRVLIKTKEYLALLLPYYNSLILELLRFQEDIRLPEEFAFPLNIKSYKILPKEIEMAERLVASMSTEWNPEKYHDDNRKILVEWIDKKIHKSKPVTSNKAAKTKLKSAKVIDFMSLLKKSIQKKEKLKTTRKAKKNHKITVAKKPRANNMTLNLSNSKAKITSKRKSKK